MKAVKIDANWWGFTEKFEAHAHAQRMAEIYDQVRRDRRAAEEQAVSCSHWGMY